MPSQETDRRQPALTGAGNIALVLLRAVCASADVFPPLKSVASGALYIAETAMVSYRRQIIETPMTSAQGFQNSKKEWSKFSMHVQESVACIVASACHLTRI